MVWPLGWRWDCWDDSPRWTLATDCVDTSRGQPSASTPGSHGKCAIRSWIAPPGVSCPNRSCVPVRNAGADGVRRAPRSPSRLWCVSSADSNWRRRPGPTGCPTRCSVISARSPVAPCWPSSTAPGVQLRSQSSGGRRRWFPSPSRGRIRASSRATAPLRWPRTSGSWSNALSRAASPTCQSPEGSSPQSRSASELAARSRTTSGDSSRRCRMTGNDRRQDGATLLRAPRRRSMSWWRTTSPVPMTWWTTGFSDSVFWSWDSALHGGVDLAVAQRPPGPSRSEWREERRDGVQGRSAAR